MMPIGQSNVDLVFVIDATSALSQDTFTLVDELNCSNLISWMFTFS